MNTPKVNPIYRAFALFGDGLTARQFEYQSERPTRDDTRFTAAARIASKPYGVIPYEEAGYYSVGADEPETPDERFDVCALPGELSCTCEDATNSKHNKSGLCKHIFAALMRAAVEEA